MKVEVVLKARPYQKELINWFRSGGKRAFEVWHRKAGKDRVATFIESELAFKRVGLYWHALPNYEDARKVIWDAITPDGHRLIDVSFPKEIIKRRLDHEMKLELINGSIWQPVGADNFNSLVGAFPVHVTYSEFALMNPKARQFIRPAIAMNQGTELIITTPRGYNHAHELWDMIQTDPAWHKSTVPADSSGVLPPEVLEEERRSMPDELFRQEYLCDWSAANLGSILGRYIETAEREGRITDEYEHDPEFTVDISSDIGFRDTASFWFWQARPDGYALIDYDEDTGLDSDDWVQRLQDKPYNYGRIWLPHDAKAKTFQSKLSAQERFERAFGRGKVAVVAQSSKADRINAARVVAPKCRWNRTKCKLGLAGLREWVYKYDDERKAYSKEPEHNWASHPGDGFSYGAQVMRDYVAPPQPRTAEKEIKKAQQPLTFNDIIRMDERKSRQRTRI